MYIAIKKEFTGQSKGQLRRKLCQMGIDFRDYEIIEIPESEVKVKDDVVQIDETKYIDALETYKKKALEK